MKKLTPKRICNALVWRYKHWLKIPLYRKMMSFKIKRIRSKKVIKVLFVITEVGPWKTKELYKTMVTHKRFRPFIGISESCEVPDEKKELIQFLKKTGIPFIDLDKDTKKKFHEISPDIIFYQKPYDGVYRKDILFWNHLKSVFCYVYYGFHSSDVSWSVNLPLFDYSWQQYFENTLAASPHRLSLMHDKGKQAVVTGLPIQDQLSQPKAQYVDPWEKQDHSKKRIIYAPHHTIGNEHLSGLALSSFLENGEIMVELMHKYEDKDQ